MNQDKQPEALRLAEWIESDMCCDSDAATVAELRRQHVRIAELEAELAAVKVGPDVQAHDVQDALTQAAREVLAAVEKLPRYTYGYKSDGESRYLRSYESPDGHFLDRDEVIAAIAASAKVGV